MSSIGEFFGTEPKCTCVERDHGYAFNQHTGITCKKHSHCVLKHPQYNSTLKLWIFPRDNVFEIGGIIKANGVISFRARCLGCGRMTTELKKSDIPRLIDRGIRYAFTRETYAKADNHLCQVKGCGRTDIEWHHFAPRNMFPDADDWPYLPLCRTHHRLWHTTMDGYRFQAKAPIEDWHGIARSNG